MLAPAGGPSTRPPPRVSFRERSGFREIRRGGLWNWPGRAPFGWSRVPLGPATAILDCYNASPESIAACDRLPRCRSRARGGAGLHSARCASSGNDPRRRTDSSVSGRPASTARSSWEMRAPRHSRHMGRVRGPDGRRVCMRTGRSWRPIWRRDSVQGDVVLFKGSRLDGDGEGLRRVPGAARRAGGVIADAV